MARAALQRLAVLHHRFDGIRRARAGKLFLFALLAAVNRNREVLFAEVAVNAQHLHRLFLRLFGSGMDGVALLPEELGRAQERAGRLLPAHDGAPLVVFERQIAPALHPLGIHRAENRLARRADRQTLGQRLGAALRDPRHFRRKALDVIRFLEQQAFRNEHRHTHVLVAGALKFRVHLLLNQLPNAVAVGLNGHAAADGGVIHQIGQAHHVGVPLGEILAARGDVLNELLLIFLRHVFFLTLQVHDFKNKSPLEQYVHKKAPRPITGTKRIASRYHPVWRSPRPAQPLIAGRTAAFLAPRLMGFGALNARPARPCSC